MLGFVIPFQLEGKGLINSLANITKQNIQGRSLVTGELNSNKVAVIFSGCGKILSASATQLLIDKFNPTRLIHLGTAGAIAPNLKIGDIALGKKVIEHDYTTLFQANSTPPSFDLTTQWQEEFLKYCATINQPVNCGTMISGDEDIVSTQRRSELFETFQALSVDWETAAVAKVAALNSIPLLALRTISDAAHESTYYEYKIYAAKVSLNLCELVIGFLKCS